MILMIQNIIQREKTILGKVGNIQIRRYAPPSEKSTVSVCNRLESICSQYLSALVKRKRLIVFFFFTHGLIFEYNFSMLKFVRLLNFLVSIPFAMFVAEKTLKNADLKSSQ